jgi:hexosaminidase
MFKSNFSVNTEQTLDKMDQVTLDEFGQTLGISYKVLDNLTDGKKTYRAQIILSNNCDQPLQNDDWAIYFCHIRMIEPGHLPHSTTYELRGTGMTITHVNGCLFKLSPTNKFKTMKKGDTLKIKFKAQHYSVARSDLMPNWYLLFPGLRPVLIQSTVGEDMSFVEPFDKPDSWKRFDYELNGAIRFDHYNPYNLQERFDRHKCPDVAPVGPSVIPTPLKLTVVDQKQIIFMQEEWVITAEKQLEQEAKFLSGWL